MGAECERLSVCICTYKRTKALAVCLYSLTQMQPPLGHSVEVIIVDNDAAASARDAVLGAVSTYPFALRYFCEEQSGVSHARNRCLSEARPYSGHGDEAHDRESDRRDDVPVVAGQKAGLR